MKRWLEKWKISFADACREREEKSFARKMAIANEFRVYNL